MNTGHGKALPGIGHGAAGEKPPRRAETPPGEDLTSSVESYRARIKTKLNLDSGTALLQHEAPPAVVHTLMGLVYGQQQRWQRTQTIRCAERT